MPAQLTSFVGREQETAEIRRLLRTTRLLTLVGAGGVGKTRLALEVAPGLVDEYADSVWLVQLAALAHPTLLPQAVATALGLCVEPSCPPIATVEERLRDRQALLLLDNCEHLITACATLADTLLRACPDLRVLATSRQSFGIAGETVWAVPPLSAPPGERPPAGGSTPAWQPIPKVLEYGAVRLFLERANAIRPSFTLTEQNVAAVEQICQRLDGIPLAIELAAARVAVLSPEQIAARLTDRFGLLTDGSRVALPRHQTLLALVDWSYDLLPEPERALLRRLSVFAGGWTLEAAEAVCGGDERRETRDESGRPRSRLSSLVSPLDLLSRLLTKSLVVGDEYHGEARYRLLQTIREYGAGKLRESGEEATVRECHLSWFTALAERAGVELFGPRQAEWYERLETEHDNFRAALEWSLSGSAAEAGLRLPSALVHLWTLRGHNSEGRAWVSRLLARAPQRTVARAGALNAAGYLAFRQGDHAPALAMLEEGLAIARELGDKPSIAQALQYMGLVRHAQQDFAQATAILVECLAVGREIGNAARAVAALQYLADIAYERGDDQRAAALYREALALAREHGNTHNIGAALRGLGHLARARGDLDRATALLADSLAEFQKLRDKKCGPLSIEGLACVAAEQGRPERAARLFGAAQALRDAIPIALAPAERAHHDRGVATARAALGDERFARAWSDGQAMTLDQAAEYALAEPGRGPRQPCNVHGKAARAAATAHVLGHRPAEIT